MRRGIAVVALAAIPLGAYGCGGDDQRFTAESFVVAVNEHGAGLALGEPLPYGRSGAELRSVSFEEDDHAAEAAEEEGHAHGSGTLAVFEDDAGALSEYERCSASELECYRAGNVALGFFGTVDPADLQRLTAAFEALAAQ